jgi:hypothetical protein
LSILREDYLNYPSDGSYTVLRRTIKKILNETGIPDKIKLSMIGELVK